MGVLHLQKLGWVQSGTSKTEKQDFNDRNGQICKNDCSGSKHLFLKKLLMK